MRRTLFAIGILLSAAFASFSTARALDLTVVITSEPVRTGEVGQPYAYDVEAVSSDPLATLTYTLHDNPPGMIIDASTGLVQWTPAVPGSFRVRIRVRARISELHEAEAEQEYALRITGGGASTSRGSVTDSAGAGIRMVEVKMFDLSGRTVFFKTRTDSLGAYEITGVAPGTFVVKADPPDAAPFEDQWYNGVRRFEDATPLVVAESAVVTIDFVLRGRDADDLRFNLFGTVRDSSGSPLAGVLVQFLRPRHDDDVPHSSPGRDSGGDDHENRVVATAFTDSLGTYHARLRSRSYVLTARKQGYRTQYWDHRNTLQGANRLRLRRDTTGIDFHLGLLPPAAAVHRPAGRIPAELGQNYPNPFNPSTQISFVLPASGMVRLTVYNVIGQAVATLVDGELPAGVHAAEWRAEQAASGLYYYRLEYGGAAQARRMLLIR